MRGKAAGSGKAWKLTIALVVAVGCGLSAASAGAGSTQPPAAPTDNPLATRPGAAPAGPELAELRTRTSRTYVAGDGTRETRIYSHSVNYRDASGKWQPIDDSLVADGASGFALENRANAYRVELPSDLSRPVRFSAGPVWVSFSPDGAAGAPVADGTQATYSGALPGVDVRYSALADSLREELVLGSASAQSSFRYRFATSPGLTASTSRDGSIVFSDRDGHDVFAFSPPVAFDAIGSRTSQVSMTLGSNGSEQWIDVSLDRGWLTDPAREFPVTIDPDLEYLADTDRYQGADQDCTITDQSPSSSSCTSATDSLGYDGTHRWRVLMKFDVASALPADADVQTAGFVMDLPSETGTTAAPIGLYPVSRSWTTGASWNSYDGTNSWTAAGGDVGSQAASFTEYTIPGWAGDFMITDLVAGWLSGSTPNDGIELRTDETTNNVYTVDSTNGSSSDWPYVDVSWEAHVGVKGQYTIDSQKLSDQSTLGVNVADGNLLIQGGGLQVAGLGLGLNAGLSYNSLADANGYSGFGETAVGHWLGVGEWQLVYDEDDSETFYDRSGAVWKFTKNGYCDYSSPVGSQMTLTCDPNDSDYFILTFLQTGEKLWFGKWSSSSVSKDVDRYGNTITYTYAGGAGWNPGDLTSITDTQGRTYTVHHATISGHDLVDYIKDDVDGRQWSYGYTAQGSLLTSVTDPDGHVVHYDYTSDTQDNLYDINKITDARGHVIDITYDSNERVATVVRETSGASGTWPTTSYDYETPDATHCGDGTSVYSGVIFQTRLTDPDGNNTYFCADSGDRVTHTYDPNGNRWAQSYNSRNNIATFTAAGTGSPLTTAVYEQDATGSGSCGQGSGYSWDNLCSISAPQAEQTTLFYTHTGWTGATDIRNFLPTKISDPQAQLASGGTGQPLNLSWDGSGNLTDISQYTDGAQTNLVHATLAYNPDGTLKTATDANGNVTNYDEYPSTDANHRQGLLKDIVSAPVSSGTRLGTATGHYIAQYDYDSAGRPDSITNGRGQTTTLAYDGEDRVTKITFSDGSCFTYGYDANGNLTERDEYSTCGGTVTHAYSYAYDELDRRTSETQPGSVTHSYGYDKAGNMTSLTDASGTTNYDYNADNTVKDVAEPGGSCTGTVSLCTTFAYDARGNRTETDTPNGLKLKDSYDNSDKLRSARAYNSTGTELRGFSYAYRLSGKTADMELAATRTNDSSGDVTTYTYDGLDRLTDAKTKTSGGSTLSDYSYVLDGDGNITHKTVVSGATTNTYYGYNGDNLLCWSATTSASGCSPAPTGATTYSYDADGNDQRFSYNNRNQTTNAFSNSLVYAGPNQFELITAGATSLANDLLGIASTKTSGATTSYTRDPFGTLIARKLSTGAHEYYEHLDNLGSITGIDNSTGASVETKAYDPYGNLTTNTSTTQADPFGYAAGYTNPYGSTIHYGLRWYDPGIQRWTQPDQLALPADLLAADPFGYVGADPINITDDDGLCFILSCKTYSRIGNGLLATLTGVGAVASEAAGIGATAACYRFTGAPECLSIYGGFHLVAGASAYASYRFWKRAFAP